MYLNVIERAKCGQKPACGLVRVAHCPYGAAGLWSLWSKDVDGGQPLAVVHGRWPVREAHCPQIHGPFYR